MNYRETGQFSPKQIKLAKEIKRKIKQLKESGCAIICKGSYLNCYIKEEEENSREDGNIDYDYPTPYLDCGNVKDCGADDELYFKKGYITDNFDPLSDDDSNPVSSPSSYMGIISKFF